MCADRNPSAGGPRSSKGVLSTPARPAPPRNLPVRHHTTHLSMQNSPLRGSPPRLVAVLALASAALPVPLSAQSAANPFLVYGLSASGDTLISFAPGQPGRLAAQLPVQGLAAGEVLLGIDFRPATGELYGLSNASRVYRIDANTALASAAGPAFAPGLVGSDFGFDFNPVPDRIRVVSEADQNLRLNPNNGALAATDGALQYAASDANALANPNVVASAYTSNFAATTTTTLYGIDSSLDVLVTQGSLGSAPVSPNSGTLFTVGALGIDASGLVGFDVSPLGSAFAAIAAPGASSSSLYSVNLGTGAASLVGPIAGGAPLRDIAIGLRRPRVYALSSSNALLALDLGNPGTPLATIPISGLPSGESLRGIDFRPATGVLYALGSSSQLYTIEVISGLAAAVGAPFSPGLLGVDFGFDFNPVPDRIRVVSDQDQNLRLNPDSGALAATDGTLQYALTDANAGAQPNVVASAYTGSFAGSQLTTLYGIDSQLDVLVTQGSLGSAPVSPNSGTLFTVGALGVDASGEVGFDISPYGGVFAAITAPGAASSQLYQIQTATGAATLIGAIGGGAVIRDLAFEPPAPPTAWALQASNSLVSFRIGRPDLVLARVGVKGLVAGEQLVGIDFRPASGLLHGLTDASRQYAIEPSSGKAVLIGSGPFAGGLQGQQFGFDFNPSVDRVRVVSDAEQNLRLHPNTGALAATDPLLAYDALDANAGADPTVVASAYTQNFAGSTGTSLFGIDATLDVLVRQGSAGSAPISPNAGTLFTIGALGIDVSEACGLDVSAFGGAFALVNGAGSTQSRVFILNLGSGAATLVGALPALVEARDLALVPPSL